MKKNLSLLSLLLLLASTSFAQGKLLAKNSHVGFFSHTTIEDIKADNNQASSILDTQSGEIVINILMKSFKFERALMEEHFNENYVESDKFPKSVFKGKISNIATVDFNKEGSYPVEIEGEMTIHGSTKAFKTKGSIDIKEGKIVGKSKFQLNPQDYNIVYPGVVKEKFAENFDITVELNYASMNK